MVDTCVVVDVVDDVHVDDVTVSSVRSSVRLQRTVSSSKFLLLLPLMSMRAQKL